MPHSYSPKLNIIKIPADLTVSHTMVQIDDNLSAYQDAIGGGYIAVARSIVLPVLNCGCRVVMVCDEDGVLRQLPHNDRASLIYVGSIVGDIFLVAEGLVANADGEVNHDFVSLPDSFASWEGPGHDYPDHPYNCS